VDEKGRGCGGEEVYIYKLLVGNPKKKLPLRIPSCP
jgi:hypothetical protein